MKSLDEVAAARREIAEVARRLGKIAWGADRSERYARELADWLAETYGDDARFSHVRSVLTNYRSKVGQEELADACRRVIEALRFDAEGPRFEWRGIGEDEQDRWQAVFGASRDVDLDAACPVCGEPALQRYLRGYGPDRREVRGELYVARGGGWEWCSACLTYVHFQALIPVWWPGAPTPDRVPGELLEHEPEFLERVLRLGRA
jgi:hypothetical protein